MVIHSKNTLSIHTAHKLADLKGEAELQVSLLKDDMNVCLCIVLKLLGMLP